jgi:alkylhydroperoxidase/carboxymuconolactone decarboxylase family protein YurZ
MPDETTAEAWVELPSKDVTDAAMPADHPYNFGFAPNMIRLVMAHPGIGPHFGQLFTSIMFEPGPLDRSERELVATVAAAAQDCFY